MTHSMSTRTSRARDAPVKRGARHRCAAAHQTKRLARRAAPAPLFQPGSVVARFVDAAKNQIDWDRAVEWANGATDGDGDAIASNPAIGLILGEVRTCGADAAALRGTRSGRYKEYALQRTLGMKAVLTRATTEAGVLDAKTRCAIGRKLADPSSGASLFHAYAKNADAAMDAFVRGVEEDLREIADGDEAALDLARTKNFYGERVTERHFAFVNEQLANALAKADESRGSAAQKVKVVPVLVPNTDATEDEEEDDENADFMFGKKSKKKKKKAAANVSAASVASIASEVSASSTSFVDALTKMVASKMGSTKEPAFPEIESWGQTTSAEASGAVVALLAGAPSGSVVILPSELMLRTLTFDVPAGDAVNSNGARAFCVDSIPDDVDAECALWVSFDPNDATEGAWRDPKFKRAFKALAKVPVVVALLSRVPDVPSADELVAAAAAASSRAHERLNAIEDEE